MNLVNKQYLLSRPTAEVSHDDFRLVATGIPELGDGQVLVRHHYLSLDPYMRGRMNAGEELRRAAGARTR
jgi:NADPH-dependent curcumin reductase CurA